MDTFRDGHEEGLSEEELAEIDHEVEMLRSGLARWVYVKGVITVETGEYL